MERAACWCAQVAPCVVVRCSELFEGQRTSDIAATETNEWRAIYSKFGLKKSVQIVKLPHLKISSQRRVPLESLLSRSTMILMKGRDQGNAASVDIVLQNELNMTRWDAKTHSIRFH